ncbi:hypothetical protein LZZ98_00625 [Acinetobacter sp. SM34]|uniref:hypothetical protein n=1 Tax=Acinetobacter sp. SM34 TaxID=1301620 RepID=UPI001EDC699A|nr:hypothetical protein [Acinetobacter sp. SM34]MCG2607070.1 hypothetical protein [Acinetobacter sp. SM34]
MDLMQFSLTLDAIRVEMKNEQSFEIAKGTIFTVYILEMNPPKFPFLTLQLKAVLKSCSGGLCHVI